MKKRRAQKGDLWTSAASQRLRKLAGEVTDLATAITVIVERYLEGISCPPTDLDALAPALRILKIEAEPLPISGELRRVPGGFVVVYSSFLSPGRRRFTIAHEMAHAIFESTGPNCPRTGGALERLCDMIATELLMPQKMFLAKCKESETISLEVVQKLSSHFKTSLSATSIRCAELLGMTFFEIERSTITWACGAIRSGPIEKLHIDLRAAIDNAKRREVFDDHLFVNTETTEYSWWKLESKKMGNYDKHFFMLKPLGKHFDLNAHEASTIDFLF